MAEKKGFSGLNDIFIENDQTLPEEDVYKIGEQIDLFELGKDDLRGQQDLGDSQSVVSNNETDTSTGQIQQPSVQSAEHISISVANEQPPLDDEENNSKKGCLMMVAFIVSMFMIVAFCASSDSGSNAKIASTPKATTASNVNKTQDKKLSPEQEARKKKQEFINWVNRDLKNNIQRDISANIEATEKEEERALRGKLIIWDLSNGKKSYMTDKLSKQIQWDDNSESLMVAAITGFDDKKVCTYKSQRSGKIIDGYQRTAKITLLAYPGGRIIGHTRIKCEMPPSSVRMKHVPNAIYGEVEGSILKWANAFPKMNYD